MRNRFVIVVALMVAVLLPGYAATQASAQGELTQEDVDNALARRRAVAADLEEMTYVFTEAMYEEDRLRGQISDLAREVARLEQEIGERRIAALDILRARYMSGGSTGTERVFTAQKFSDIPVQSQYFDLVNDRDLVMLRGLEAAEARHVEYQDLLDRALIDQGVLVGDLSVLAEELSSALAQADADYGELAAAFQRQEEERIRREEEARKAAEEAARRAAEEAARKAAEEAAAATSTTSGTSGTTTTSEGEQTTTTESSTTTEATTTTETATTTTTQPPAPPPVVTDGKTCPVNAAVSFSDTWGAPRSGGRTHKGVDMVAARNAPLVAIETGTVTRISDSSLGGLSVYLTGISGARYYYAHLEYFADGISGGTSVSVGQLLGGNGSSGNAPDWLPHLHFQYAPPGSDWINPYPLVKALC